MYVSKQIHNKLEKSKKDIEKYPSWMKCVKNTFPYEKISKFDSTKRISRAFYKLYELVRKYNLLKNDTTFLNICCLCEAPGGFVEALINIAKKEKRLYNIITYSHKDYIKYSPKIPNEIINYKDVTKLEDVLNIVKHCSNEKYDFITADGGVDVSEDYLNQEVLNKKLILCEVIVMLYTLKIGGNFMLKVFDCFTDDMIKTLWILFDNFEHVEIVKPLMSRPCNSEKYILCFGFKGYKTINGLMRVFDKSDYNLQIIVPQYFKNQMIGLNNAFASNQINNLTKTALNYKINKRLKHSTGIPINNSQYELSKKMYQLLKI